MKSEDQFPKDAVAVSATAITRRLGWIAVRLVLVYALATEFQPFFYQAF